jgi:hypothetical protein
VTWDTAVAAAKVIRVVTGIPALVVSMMHPQITLANKMTALLPSTQLRHHHIAVMRMLRTLPLNH